VQVYAGAGSWSALPDLLAEMGSARPFLVCGPQVATLPEIRALGNLAGAFMQVESDPSDATIAAAGQAARAAQADLILAVGGGSSLDAAKAIAAEALAPDWIAAADRPGQATELPAGALPVLAVPTTAGTASEVTPFAVITFLATQHKLVLNHPALLPRAALLDPNLLLSAPREARVAAGLDALTHGIESYVSRQATEATRARSQEAVLEIARHLPRGAAEHPHVDSLGHLQRAALLAGLAFSKTRLGVVHALALPLSVLFGVPHGVANAILLPHGILFNIPAAGALYGNLSLAFRVQSSGRDAEPSAERLLQGVRELATGIGSPTRLRDVGVSRGVFGRMAQEAAQSAHLATNPRPADLSDLIEIYKAAY
jgi:alcohol dehydrogenase class IV